MNVLSISFYLEKQEGLFPLLPRVVDLVSDSGIPVIAAGGIVDGRGYVAALALGAQGVCLGTRYYLGLLY
jgi:NAD(P)H-dependent flavin oxidoreductase YrpB (nitropropane dioxygenase family)